MTLQKMAGVFCRFWSLEMTTFVKTGNMPQQEKDQAALINCASSRRSFAAGRPKTRLLSFLA
jgi:hypothetical protein